MTATEVTRLGMVILCGMAEHHHRVTTSDEIDAMTAGIADRLVTSGAIATLEQGGFIIGAVEESFAGEPASGWTLTMAGLTAAGGPA